VQHHIVEKSVISAELTDPLRPLQDLRSCGYVCNPKTTLTQRYFSSIIKQSSYSYHIECSDAMSYFKTFVVLVTRRRRTISAKQSLGDMILIHKPAHVLHGNPGNNRCAPPSSVRFTSRDGRFQISKSPEYESQKFRTQNFKLFRMP